MTKFTSEKQPLKRKKLSEMLRGKKVLLGVTASIAAYKSAHLVRLLVKAGAEVRVLMTPSAVNFITPLTLSTLSKNPVYLAYFDGKSGEWNSHVDLAEWADLLVIAPLSANTMSKLANGITDNLLLATYLSSRSEVYLAPAMDMEMYKHDSVRSALEKLESRGHFIIAPGTGELASGLDGEGRMEEPENIIDILNKREDERSLLKKKKVLVTAGPTVEHLDPVRYITNHSSGKMGLALAVEAYRSGAEVTMIHGPMKVTIPEFIRTIPVTSAQEMYDACMIENDCDIIIMSAAVADYAPAIREKKKIKKNSEAMSLELLKTKDILKELGRVKPKGQFLVGFALETDNGIANATAKLLHKHLDLIILNIAGEEGSGFEFNTNKVTLIGKDKKAVEFPLKNKSAVARDIIGYIAGSIK